MVVTYTGCCVPAPAGVLHTMSVLLYCTTTQGAPATVAVADEKPKLRPAMVMRSPPAVAPNAGVILVRTGGR